MDWSAIAADFAAHWYIYLSMPLVAALIGYVTKLVAIRMMFQPLEFVGIRPFFGWQGVIPNKAEKMAGIAVELMTSRLISVREIFDRLDPERVTQEIEQPLLAAVEQITREVLAQHKPGLWEMMPEIIRSRLIKRIQAEAPEMVAEIMSDIRANIDQLFDLKHMVIANLVRDKALLNRIFREVGHREFRFIAHSGIWFGALIGLVQMVTWIFYKSPWILPAFGGFCGFLTDWVALKLLFNPKLPKKYFGITFHGLFLKRQQEVAHDYADLIAREILTPRNFWDAILRGPMSDRLFTLVQKHVAKGVDEQAGIARPMVAFAVGSRQYQDMKKAVADKLMEHFPTTIRHVDRYAEDAMDIRNTLIDKMQKLTPLEFEGLLRPAFREDEWILIGVGAVLGFLVGELQVQVLLQ